MDNSRLEILGNGVVALVSDAHRFGTDAFLLSRFARVRRGEVCCDLGCGCGIIPLLWFTGENAPASALALDIQPEAAALAREGARRSGLADRLRVLEADLRALDGADVPKAAFDLVTCNPPYKPFGAGVMSSSDSDQIARHETMCTINDVCAAAARLLRFGGRLCVCQRSERLVDVLHAMRAHGIEPKRLRMVQKNAASAPWLLLVEGKLGSKPFLQVEPPLLLQEPDGGMSAELREIYALYSGKESQ